MSSPKRPGKRTGDEDLPPAPAARRKKKKAAEADPTPVWKPWLRYGSWVLMGCFAIGAAAEARAQISYQHNLRVILEALDRADGNRSNHEVTKTYEEIKGRLWSTPTYSTAKGALDRVENGVYTWSWQGLRKYELRLFVDPKDGRLRDVPQDP